MALTTHSDGFLSVVSIIHSYAFDTNLRTVEGPMVYIAKTPRGEWDWFDVQTIRRNCIRCGEGLPRATYGSQLTQTLPRGAARRIENAESLR